MGQTNEPAGCLSVGQTDNRLRAAPLQLWRSWTTSDITCKFLKIEHTYAKSKQLVKTWWSRKQLKRSICFHVFRNCKWQKSSFLWRCILKLTEIVRLYTLSFFRTQTRCLEEKDEKHERERNTSGVFWQPWAFGFFLRRTFCRDRPRTEERSNETIQTVFKKSRNWIKTQPIVV